MIHLNDDVKKIHGCAMECHKLLVESGFSEKDATDTVVSYLNELIDGGIFELGHRVVIAYLKSAFPMVWKLNGSV